MKTFEQNFKDMLKKAYQIIDHKTKKRDFEVKTVSFDLKISYKNNKLDSIKDNEYNLYYFFDGKIQSYTSFFQIIDELLLLD